MTPVGAIGGGIVIDVLVGVVVVYCTPVVPLVSYVDDVFALRANSRSMSVSSRPVCP